MPRQTTIALVLREEVEQFEKLMNNGMPLETLIHLVFKKDEEMISRLKVGISLVDIFCMGQKKLYFKYLKILSTPTGRWGKRPQPRARPSGSRASRGCAA